ncbi:YqzL family protein [Ferviditalea candida]|uniref:YqzL family protein n=1 Tax=Ferviditalea candida TaxID=3108399 RepID=A0ABU5ZDU7_9BACL|nr:YqzL family protein [Paenibacillaceae bacterium T2]
MRDFTWKYFAATGDVDAYLLYKDMQNYYDDMRETEEETDVEELPE